MSEITRYSIAPDGEYDHPAGEFVFYRNHLAALAAKDAAVTEVLDDIERILEEDLVHTRPTITAIGEVRARINLARDGVR